MSGLTHLSIYSSFAFPAQEIARLGALTNLESLSLHGAFESASAIDVSRLSALRHLTIAGSYGGSTLPIGVLDLPLLERLNLRQTFINDLPDSSMRGVHA